MTDKEHKTIKVPRIMTATVYTLRLNITHTKKILIARNIDNKRRGW